MIKKAMILGGGVLGALVLAACSSSSGATATDAGARDAVSKADTGATKGDAAKDAEKDAVKAASDAGGHDAAGEGGAVARHVLVTYAGTSPSTLFAVNLATKAIDGKLTTADSQAVADTSSPSAPFLLNQTLDTVDRVDPAKWTVDSSWSVAQKVDAGGPSDPYAVAVSTGKELFVARYGSNVIDVFDTTQAADAGPPKAVVDLTPLLQANDHDGLVEATAIAYEASTDRVYVVLANIDRGATIDYQGSFDTACVKTTSTVVAIDGTTHGLLGMHGTGPAQSLALQGYDPTSAYYDAANHRLLVFEAGCNPDPTADGGAPGKVQQRGIEAVDLVANTSAILLDASDQGFPGSFAYIDAHHAAVGFSYPAYTAFAWDPTTTTLGAALPGAPDLFDSDGNGNLVGASITYGDGGSATTDIVSMSLATGAVTTLQSNVITVGNGYLGSVGVWPRP